MGESEASDADAHKYSVWMKAIVAMGSQLLTLSTICLG